MKGRDLLVLKAELELHSASELQRRLGISSSTWKRWVIDDPDQELPLHIALACEAIIRGLGPYKPAELPNNVILFYGGGPARRLYETQEEQVKAAVAEARRRFDKPALT